ncbi:MAG: hypothetical protein NTV51_23630, partial [Verrucomicrobia bacterium]|nr:hypothetical protein [Verrucomicrobiota bacterium]
MKTRRDFLKLTAAGTLATAATHVRAASVPASSATLSSTPAAPGAALPSSAPAASTGAEDRAAWVRLAQKLSSPLLPALA